MKFQRLKAEGCICPKNLLDDLIPYWCEAFERRMWETLEEARELRGVPVDLSTIEWGFPRVYVKGTWIQGKIIEVFSEALGKKVIDIQINLLEYYRELTRAAFEHTKMKSFREWTRLSKHTEELLQQAKVKLQIITEEIRRASRSERLPQSDIKSTSMAASMPVPPLKIPKGDLLYNLITG